MILISNFPHFILTRIQTNQIALQLLLDERSQTIENLNCKLHMWYNICRCIQCSYVYHPRSKFQLGEIWLSVPSPTDTEKYQTSVKDCSYIWSCCGTQILTVRINFTSSKPFKLVLRVDQWCRSVFSFYALWLLEVQIVRESDVVYNYWLIFDSESAILVFSTEY